MAMHAFVIFVATTATYNTTAVGRNSRKK